MTARHASCVLALWAGCATSTGGAQVSPPKPVGAPGVIIVDPPILPSHRMLAARTDDLISTRTSKAGDLIGATVQTRLIDRHGQPLLAARTKILLRVSRVTSGGGVTPGRIELEPVAIRGGCLDHQTDVQLNGSVEVAEVAQVPTEIDESRISRGSLAGLIFGSLLLGGGLLGVQGAVVGYDIGKTGAIAAEISDRTIEAVIVPGTQVWVSLDAPLPLSSLGCPYGQGG